MGKSQRVLELEREVRELEKGLEAMVNLAIHIAGEMADIEEYADDLETLLEVAMKELEAMSSAGLLATILLKAAVEGLQETEAKLATAEARLEEYRAAERRAAEYEAAMVRARNTPEVVNWAIHRVVLEAAGLSIRVFPSVDNATRERRSKLGEAGNELNWTSTTANVGLVNVDVPLFGVVQCPCTIRHTEEGGEWSWTSHTNTVEFVIELGGVSRLVTLTSSGDVVDWGDGNVEADQLTANVQVDRSFCGMCNTVHEVDSDFANPQQSEATVTLA